MNMSVKTEILKQTRTPFLLIGLLTFLGLSTANAFFNKSASTDYNFLNNEKPNTLSDVNKESSNSVVLKSSSYEKQLYTNKISYLSIINSKSLNNLSKTKKKLLKLNKGLDSIPEQRIVTTEIDALLLDATFSPGGYDFYIDFSQNFTPPAGASGYTVLVKEYPGRGANIVVAVEVNGKQLVYRRLRPIYPAVHGLSVSVANYLSGYLARGDHLSGVDADGNFIDSRQTNSTRQIKTPFDVY